MISVVRKKVRAERLRIKKTVRTTTTVKTTVKVKEVRERSRTTTSRKVQGVVLHRGPSLLDGSPIVVVAVGLDRKSKNAKTGAAVQTYILSDQGENPLQAVNSGADRSVCGDCPHRGLTCYVNLARAPLAVYRAVQRGSYPLFHPPAHLHLFAGRFVRLGAYGDPAAVPLRVWRLICGVATHWTGYTHQWRICDQELRHYCMASVETAHQRERAVAMGWRTFRVRLAQEPLEPGEFSCPASEEEGRRLTCEQCGACDGAKASPKAASPSIVFHAPHNAAGDWMRRNYKATVARLHEEEQAASRRVSLPLAG